MTICDKCKATKNVQCVLVTMEVFGDEDATIACDYTLDLCATCRTQQKGLVRRSKITAGTQGRER